MTAIELLIIFVCINRPSSKKLAFTYFDYTVTYADIFQPKAPCSENNYREYGKKIVEHQYNSMAILSQTYPIRAVIVNGTIKLLL